MFWSSPKLCLTQYYNVMITGRKQQCAIFDRQMVFIPIRHVEITRKLVTRINKLNCENIFQCSSVFIIISSNSLSSLPNWFGETFVPSLRWNWRTEDAPQAWYMTWYIVFRLLVSLVGRWNIWSFVIKWTITPHNKTNIPDTY